MLKSSLPRSLRIFTGIRITANHVLSRGIAVFPTTTIPAIASVLTDGDPTWKRPEKQNKGKPFQSSGKNVPPRPSRQFLITTSSQSTITENDVLKRISQTFRASEWPLEVAHGQAIVILATPAFASWLESQTFLQRTLKTLFQHPYETKNSPLKVTVVLAVVDGLPLPRGTHALEPPSSEGFAILYGEQTAVLPGASVSRNVQPMDRNHHSTLTFLISSESENSSQFSTEVVLPLANTLFRNGRSSTLLVSSWERESSPREFVKIFESEPRSLKIRPWSTRGPTSLRIFLPLVPLTPARRVESGLGNIVRQIAGDNLKPVPASRELEENVDAYLQSNGLDRQTVEIWALVIPQRLLTREGVSKDEAATRSFLLSKMTSHDKIRDDWSVKMDVGHRSHTNYWLTQGAGLYRVLSGGGGWGVKQGLLSLDPERSPSTSTGGRYDFDDPDAGETSQVEALGNIAEPGSMIQFFIYPHVGQEKATEGTVQGICGDVDEESAGHENICSTTFGCVPSSIDDIPLEFSTVSGSGDEMKIVNIHVAQGHFGAQSESGIFIKSTGAHPDSNSPLDAFINSKIDVPYSFIRESSLNLKSK